MLSKLLKKDLNKNMRWLWILFAATIVVSAITRGCKELGENIAFFKILGIFFDSVFYALAVNGILQPFLRNFLNFHKSFYSDESYLTHTLPVTKNQLINSKYLTAVIELVAGFACVVASLLIMYASPEFSLMLKMLISSLVVGSFSLGLAITLIILLIIVEFFMYISIIYFAIVVAYRAKEHRAFKAFLITAAMALSALAVLAVVLVVVLAINGVKLSASTLVLSSTAFVSVILAAIVVYSLVSVLFYFLTKREFNKGVNVD